jgi:hypothetical protein
MNRRNKLEDITAWENTTEIAPKECKCGTDSFSSPKDYLRAIFEHGNEFEAS